MAETARQEFRELSDRFKFLASAQADDKTGIRDVCEAAEAAAKALKRFGILSGEIDFVKPTKVVDADEASRWAMLWQAFCFTLRKDHYRIPSAVGLTSIIGRGAGIVKAADWRKRARDYSIVCELLADELGQPSQDDQTGYVFANEIAGFVGFSLSRFNKWLEKIPETEIRRKRPIAKSTNKPSKNRSQVHAGDVIRYLKTHADDPKMVELLRNKIRKL